VKKKILLGHLNSNGDCLFVTVIARQIKEVDYPDSHLTWAVGARSRQAVELNPYVDEIWEIPTEKTLATQEEWRTFVTEAEERKREGDFDLLFFTQVIGENEINYDGGIRSSIYNNYPHKITVPFQPVIRLSDAEVENVRRFAEKHELGKYRQVILVECAPASFDVALNPQSAYQLASEIIAEDETVAVILSSNMAVESSSPNIIDASELTFRENAELTKYCTLFVGCASGISWLVMSDWAKQLDMILVINQHHNVLPSMIYDLEYWKLPAGHIIEVRNDGDSLRKVKACIAQVWAQGFESARETFNEKIRLSNYSFLDTQIIGTATRLDFAGLFACLRRVVRRNGIHFNLIAQLLKTGLELSRITANKLLRVLGLKQGEELANQHK
jgi:hypothetical protein